MLQATSIGQDWLDRLAVHVSLASGAHGAADAADSWGDDLAKDDRVAELLYRTSLQAWMGGQLMVRAIELAPEAADGEKGTVLLGAPRGEAVRDFSESFLGMPFEQALEFFRGKHIISNEEFDALTDQFKAGGFIARDLATDRLVEVARSTIERLLAAQISPEEAARIIRAAEAPEVQALGISASAPGYIETVVRTNSATSYGYGRWQAMEDPAVKALRPYRQFWSAGDSRVRRGHRALHGLVFDADGELAARYATPLYYNCRCSQTTLSARQFGDRGLQVTTERVPEIEAEEFWSGAPGPLEAA